MRENVLIHAVSQNGHYSFAQGISTAADVAKAVHTQLIYLPILPGIAAP